MTSQPSGRERLRQVMGRLIDVGMSDFAATLDGCVLLTESEAASIANWFQTLPTSPPPPTISMAEAVALLTPEKRAAHEGKGTPH